MSVHFEEIPEKLLKDNIAVRCKIAEEDPELCDGWCESFDVGRDRVKMDGYGRLYFPDSVATTCPECGDRVLVMNGVVVNFHA